MQARTNERIFVSPRIDVMIEPTKADNVLRIFMAVSILPHKAALDESDPCEIAGQHAVAIRRACLGIS